MKSINYFSGNNREFISFGGECPFQCLHCYTFGKEFEDKKIQARNLSSIENIIKYLEEKQFDIIYVSGYKENFIDPDKGLDLIEALFSKFKCNILFTTRNTFNDEQILRVSKLNKLMKDSGKCLFACVSISAYDSYRKLEPYDKTPDPEKRIIFLRQLYENDITSFLTLRPICPDSFIPTKEYFEILEKSYKFCSAVITSGIYVNDSIIDRLKSFPENYGYVNEDWRCFGNMPIKAVDVSKELSEIKTFCKEKEILVFDESIPAINHFYDLIQPNSKD